MSIARNPGKYGFRNTVRDQDLQQIEWPGLARIRGTPDDTPRSISQGSQATRVSRAIYSETEG